MAEEAERKGGKLAPGREKSGVNTPWFRKEKPKNFGKSIAALFSYLGRYKWAIFAGVILSIAGSVLGTIGPQFIRGISDEIYDGIKDGAIDAQAVAAMALSAAILYLFSILFGSLQHYIITSTSEKVANGLRRDLIHKISLLPLNFYDNSNTGDVMSRLTNDADTVGNHCGSSFSMLAVAVTTLVGSLVMMFYTNAFLAAICVIPPMLGFLCMRTVISRTHKYFLRQSKDLGAMNGLVEEVYYGHKIVSAYSNEDECRGRFEGINDDLYKSVYKSRFISSAIPQIMGFIGNLGYVIVCVVGSMMIISGQITYGVIIAFILYVRMFSFPLLSISETISSLQSLAASSERIFDLLYAPEMDDESSKSVDIGEVRGDVEFRNVSFGYIEGVEVLHDFSMKVKHGQKIAIVGPTGAGKTTVINLLMRFYETDSGDILIDGISTKDMRRDQVHSLFSMVLQDAWLFSGTIEENIIFNREGIGREQVEEACRSAGIHDFIQSLPSGYDTYLGDSGGISAGQKQQLTIARALLSDAPLVIFDEATSSIDTRTEKVIQNAIGKLTEGKTSFIIAHRLSTILDCDRIIVMKSGKIIETGTHEELLEKKGFYANLYGSQFENCS